MYKASWSRKKTKLKLTSVWTGQPTIRDEESRVVEVRKSVSVVAFFSFLLAAFLTDDESREGSIHWVIGHLTLRADRRGNQESMPASKAPQQGFTLWMCPSSVSHCLDTKPHAGLWDGAGKTVYCWQQRPFLVSQQPVLSLQAKNNRNKRW